MFVERQPTCGGVRYDTIMLHSMQEACMELLTGLERFFAPLCGAAALQAQQRLSASCLSLGVHCTT